MATNTYVALATETVAVATPSFTFSAISGAYTDLVVVMAATRSADGGDFRMQFNGDTATNYSHSYIDGYTSATGGRASSQTYINFTNFVGSSTTLPTATVINIMNYANATTTKTVAIRNNQFQGAFAETQALIALWRKTPEAITSITFSLNSGNYAVGTKFSLYGIKAATMTETTPKASGGFVYSDDTYYYHAFPYSSAFVPNQSLTADVLVVAGGGSALVGGGGAGGLRQISGVSCTAQSYAITVGAGGVNPRTSPYYPSANGSGSSALTYVANGGGGSGQTDTPPKTGSSGGSGGGGAGDGASVNAGGAGNAGVFTPAEGFAGGASVSTAAPYVGGGGGGAGGVGQAAQASNVPGHGGIGATSALINAMGKATGYGEQLGAAWYFAGGGAGGSADSLVGPPTFATGGFGGGGDTAPTTTSHGQSGASATGGGGGARWGNAGTSSHGGNGGSGIVIIRYTKA